MSQSSFLRIASVLPADVLLSDYEPFNHLGSGTYGVSVPASVSEKTAGQVAGGIRKVFAKGKTCGWSPLRAAKAVFFDMDSTVVAEETIVELARFAGKDAEVAAITERAMRGELDFKAALKERVATLAGLSNGILEQVSRHMNINKGMEEFAAFCRETGVPFFLVSGGFMEVAAPFKERLGFTEIRANRLGVKDGLLTGVTEGPVIDGEAKLQFMRDMCEKLGVTPAEVAAVGDGANDLPMLKAAGVGVGFKPRPVLLDHVQATIFDGDHRFLAPLLFGRSTDHIRVAK